MLTVAIDEDVKNVLSNFVDENAALLLGRIPGFKNEHIQLVSSNETKVHVWKCSTRACEESNKQAECYTKFTDFWKQFFPNVVMAKPMTDLCFTCQQNTLKLVWAANLPEEEKSQCVQARQPHLNSVHTERELYGKVCEKAKCSFEDLEDQIDLEESHETCMLRTTTQVHTPSNPMQPGPI